jgi:hypothetical protein
MRAQRKENAMGTYYYLLNDTKKQCIDYDSCVKSEPIQYNEAVHMAIVNYMFENQYDQLRFVNDYEEADEIYYYEAVDLRKHKYRNEEITKLIEEKMQKIENKTG